MYTDEEIHTAVSSLIRTSIRRPTDSLGVRQIEVTFNDVQEAASGLFLLNQTSSLYLIQMGASRLLEALQVEADLVAQLYAALSVTARNVYPVENLSPLSNAKVALFELDSAVSSRTTSFKKLERAPAFQRFNANVDKFLSDNGLNIKSGGAIVATPQQAKIQIRALLPQVKEAHAETIRLLSLLQVALADYEALNLPSLAASGVIGRSRETISRILVLLEPQKPLERLEPLREVILALLSAKAVLRGIGDFKVPSEFFDLTGSGTPFSDASHLATPAKLSADKFAPYNILGSPILIVTVDGGAPFNVTLTDALYPRIDALISEGFNPVSIRLSLKGQPFNVQAGLSDTFSFYLFDPAFLVYVPITLTLPPGPQTAVSIAAAIQAAIVLAGLVASYAATAAGVFVQIAALFVSPDAKIVFGAGNANTLLGFNQTGGYLFTALAPARLLGRLIGPFNTTGPGAAEFEVSLFHPAAKQSIYVKVTVTIGLAVPTATIALDINAAILAVGLDASYFATDVTGHLQLQSTAGTPYQMTIGGGGLNAIVGFANGQDSKGTDDNRTLIVDVPGLAGSPFTQILTAGARSATQVAAEIQAARGPNFLVNAQGAVDNQFVVIQYQGAAPPAFTSSIQFPGTGNTAAPVLGFLTDVPFDGRPSTARQVVQDLNVLSDQIRAQVEVIPLVGGSSLLARTEPTDPSLVVVYKVRGDATATVPGLLTLGLTLASGTFTNVVVGDVVAVRDGVNAGSKWTITSVAGASLVATGTFTPVAGACFVEVGPVLGAVFGDVVEVTTGTQSGIYTIAIVGPGSLAIPFEFEVDGILPGFSTLDNRSNFFTCNVGKERVVVTSRNTTITSALTLDGPGGAFLFTAIPANATGTTPWLQLPSVVSGLGNGDLLVTYATSYLVPDTSHIISSVEGALIGFSPDISSVGTFTFSLDTVPPFARLRSSAFDSYNTMRTRIATWLTLPANKANYFPELDRRINIILIQGNPTVGQVNDALNQLGLLSNILLQATSTAPAATAEYLLVQYSVPRVAPVDELIRAYTEKGCGRALDILIEGRFSDFFNLDVHGVSYSGALLGKMREIAQQDVPVRKINRVQNVLSQVTSTSASSNFEFDTSDSDTTPLADVPTHLDQIPHGTDPATQA